MRAKSTRSGRFGLKTKVRGARRIRPAVKLDGGSGICRNKSNNLLRRASRRAMSTVRRRLALGLAGAMRPCRSGGEPSSWGDPNAAKSIGEGFRGPRRSGFEGRAALPAPAFDSLIAAREAVGARRCDPGECLRGRAVGVLDQFDGAAGQALPTSAIEAPTEAGRLMRGAADTGALISLFWPVGRTRFDGGSAPFVRPFDQKKKRGEGSRIGELKRGKRKKKPAIGRLVERERTERWRPGRRRASREHSGQAWRTARWIVRHIINSGGTVPRRRESSSGKI